MNRRARTGLVVALVMAVLAGCGRPVDPATAVGEAQALVDAGKSGEARILLKNALVKQARLPGARELLARIALDAGDTQAAQDELAAADAADLGAQARALQVQIALDLGQPETAGRLLDAAWDELEARERTLLRARVLVAQGMGMQALLQLRALQARVPADPDVGVQVAATLAALGNAGEAIAELDRVIAASPQADALRLRGELLLRQGDGDRAAGDLRTAIDSAPPGWPGVQRLGAELALGDALLAAGRLDEAAVQVAHIETQWPGVMGVRLLQARQAVLEGRPADAVERLEPLRDAAPGNLVLLRLLADAQLRADNPRRAVDLLEKVIAAQPGDADSRRTLAGLWARLGRPARAMALLDEAGLEAGSDEALAAARVLNARARRSVDALAARVAAAPDDVAARVELANAQVLAGAAVDALSTLGQLPQDRFTPAQAAVQMSALLANSDELGVNSLVDRLLDPAVDASVATLLAAADAAQRERRAEVTGRLLERALVLEPDSGEVLLRKASLDFDAHRHDEAAKVLQAMLERSPGDAQVSLALARVAIARGDVAAARSTLDAMVAAQSGDEATAAAAVAAGRLLQDAGQAQAAQAAFERATRAMPGEAAHWLDLARAQLASADTTAARASIERSIALQPTLAAVQMAVRVGLQQGETQQAQALAAGFARQRADDADAWQLAGDAAEAAGDLAAAATAYARGFKLRPAAAAAMGEYRTRRRLGDARAAAPLESWLIREPNDAAVHRLLGEYFLGTGNAPAAIRHFSWLQARMPGDLAAINNLAWLLRESDNARALELALQAQAIAPDNPAVADTLGMVYLAGGAPGPAVEALARASAREPGDTAMQYHYGLALQRAGQTAEARTVLRRLLEQHDDFAERRDARRLLEEL